MHKFKRPEEPQCLIDARAKKETWETFRKAELTECLHRAQDGCCAYCDMKLKRDEKGRLKAHIEHLSRRCENRTGVFDWENLFLSCEHSESCGKYKDKQYKKLQNGAPVNVENIVDPSKEEPLDYFRYTVLGRVAIND
ncbi:MAG: TIGR02646 family protein [Thermoguttaceae bacterium]|nr:TIGR02646 family protein [Thermoguttaceae bacterium]